jgi:phosphate transport system protein
MASTHILSAYDDELKYLSRRISEMGGLAEQMCGDAVRALVNSDSALAQKVISDDVILDHAEREIQDKAIVTIARRQPMAADLREIVGTLRIGADLERVGDLGKNTAKRVIAVQGTGVPRKLARGTPSISPIWRLCSSRKCWMSMPAAPPKRPKRSASATKRSTRCTPRCSGNSSPI